MEPEYLDAYARLFGKFVDAYRAEGVNIQMGEKTFNICLAANSFNTIVIK